CATPQGQSEPLANRMAGALVIGVRMRQGVCRQAASTKLPHDSPESEPRSRIDQHSAHHVDVDTERRKAIQQLKVLGQSFHILDPTRIGSRIHTEAVRAPNESTRLITKGGEPGVN